MIRKVISLVLLIFSVSILAPMAGNAAQKGELSSAALGSSLNALKEDILSYFIPLSGSVSSIAGKSVVIDKGKSASVKEGMRITAFKEGAPFVHPVTKEQMGNVQMPVGIFEVHSAETSAAKGVILSGKPEDFAGARIKIPARKIRLLFYQGNIDWYLGDAYYHSLLDSGRFEIIDTALQNASAAEVITEAKAKGAEVALILSAEESKNAVDMTQKLYWVSDGKQFSEAKTSVHVAAVKQLKFSAGAFAPREGEALLTYKMPFSAKRLTVGDFDGDGSPDIVLASGDHVGIYRPDLDLKLQWEFDPPGTGEVLWADSVDAKKNGRDVLLITTMSDGRPVTAPTGDSMLAKRQIGSRTRVRSYIYALEAGAFKLIWQADDIFLRKVENVIAAQSFSEGEGFEGKMYALDYDNGTFKKGAYIKLPQGINIYDFQYVYAPDGRRALFAWDENGFLNFYNDKGVRTWVSNEDFGGFADAYKKESGNLMIEKGNWTLKDRLVSYNAEVIAPKRKSMINFARSIGYSSSELRSFWWNGISVEEASFLEEISGNILDYTVVNDRLIVLVKPYLLSNAKDLLKGKNPMGIKLYVFSTKGR
ncbi:MAG TPA: VCBS repeat-containing protein [Dissulfurispiraceae bacterium]|nr:VCBS repeat-containing protein [Dissulfurispiraceae bacterium]